MRRWLITGLVVAMTTSCGFGVSSNSALEEAILAAKPGEGLGILERSGIDGDRVCVLGPYSGPEAFFVVTGVEWPDIEATGITDQDTIELVAVIDGDEVVAWATPERPHGSEAVGAADDCVG